MVCLGNPPYHFNIHSNTICHSCNICWGLKLNMIRKDTQGSKWSLLNQKESIDGKQRSSQSFGFYFCSADITAMTLRLLGESPFDTCHSWTLNSPVQSAHAPTKTAEQILVDLVRSLPAIIAIAKVVSQSVQVRGRHHRSSHCATFFRKCQSWVKSRACPKENLIYLLQKVVVKRNLWTNCTLLVLSGQSMSRSIIMFCECKRHNNS